MKKTVVFIMALSLVLSAALVFATDEVSSWTSGTLTFKASASVTVLNSSNTTTYAAVAKHFQGDKRFGATSTSTTLYSSASTAGYTLTDAEVTGSDSSAFGSGWSAL